MCKGATVLPGEYLDHSLGCPLIRPDRWRGLHVAARGWAHGNADAAMSEIFDGLSAYQGFFAYQGRQLIARGYRQAYQAAMGEEITS